MSRERTGTIDRVGDKFRLRMTLPNGEREALGTFDTWGEADRMRRASLEALEARPGGAVMCLVDFGDTWLADRERNRKVRRPENDRSRWDNHVLPHRIADMPLRAIRAGDLDDLVSSMHAKGLARSTITNTLNVVRGIWKSAMRRGLVKHDPFAAGVPVPKDARITEPWTFATPEEQGRILAASKEPIRHLVAFAIASGLRAGELVALRLVDTHDDRVVVRYGGAPAEPTKGGRVRTVFLNGLAKEALTAWLVALPAYTANKRFPEGRNPLGLVFPGRRGGYRCEEHVIRWADWQGILERAGITRKFRWHDLRHSCASSLVSGWWGRRWSLEEVREVLGHQDIKTTQRYAHLASDAIALAASETGYAPSPTPTMARDIGPTIGSPSGNVAESLAPSARIELAANGLGNRCSIH